MDLLCFCSVLCLLCLYVFMCFVVTCWKRADLFVCCFVLFLLLYVPSRLSFVVSTVSSSLSHWYPGSGVVLDCIDS